MSANFKFGGRFDPFWTSDPTGRIRISIDRGRQDNTGHQVFFYADGATVGRVAAVIEQALFGDEEARGPDVLDDPTDQEARREEWCIRSAVNEIRSQLRRKNRGPLTLDQARELKEAEQSLRQSLKTGSQRDAGPGHSIPADQEAWEAYQCSETLASEEASREGPPRDYPEDAISPGE